MKVVSLLRWLGVDTIRGEVKPAGGRGDELEAQGERKVGQDEEAYTLIRIVQPVVPDLMLDHQWW